MLNIDREEAILNQRAEQLARRRDREEKKPSQPFLLVQTHGENYALALDALSEVIPMENVSPIPGASAELLGIISHRGELKAIFDLATLMNLPGEKSGAGFVLLPRSKAQAGFRVDAVAEIQWLTDEALEQAANAAGDSGRLCRGQAGGNLNIIDTAKLLSLPQLS